MVNKKKLKNFWKGVGIYISLSPTLGQGMITEVEVNVMVPVYVIIVNQRWNLAFLKRTLKDLY